MKQSIRIACALLALLTVSPAVISCGNSADSGSAAVNTGVSTDTQAVTEDANAIKDNLPELDFGGEKQLASALEAENGIKIDKYIRSTDSSFKSLINSFGGFETTVEEAIDVRSDRLTAIIGAGKQSMTGDTLLKYIRYYENEPKTQAEIIADIVEQEITPANFKKADSHYTRVINLVKSDISVVDFASVKTGIDALLYSGEAVKVSVK